MRRTRPTLTRLNLPLVVIAGLVTFIGLTADAGADFYPGSYDTEINSRTRTANLLGGGTITGRETAYLGPQVIVRGDTTNTDSYQCGHGSATNWVAVPADASSATRSFTSSSNAYVKQALGSNPTRFTVTTTDWSSRDINIRVIYSCTSETALFPYGGYTGSPLLALGKWISNLFRGRASWDAAVGEGFGWYNDTRTSSSRGAGATAAAGESAATQQMSLTRGKRIKLRNGTNHLRLHFKHPKSSQRPPAILFSTQPADADCVARRLHVPVIDGRGLVNLKLRCRGLERGTTARLKIRKSITRKFPLGEGEGTVRVRLDKPPGKVEPLVHVRAHPADAPCRVLDRKLDTGRRELDLELDLHCGRGARRARGELYIGGLIAAGR